MDVGQLKDDVRAGRVTTDRLIELIELLSRRLQQAERRIAELEKKLGPGATAKVEESFSVRAEEKRQEARGKVRRRRKTGGRRGRITTAEKVQRAERTERCFPAGVAESACWLSHTRPVWRLEEGRAVLVAYEIYRGPHGQYGKIRGVLGRSEFGLEIVIAISYQVHLLGLSFGQVCLLMGFFLQLNLKKSQVDALLTRLARHWEGEFERLCTLLANSAVVHADETGWSLNSVWAFLSEQARVLLFGVHKDAATLEQILDPALFAGILISDDAAVYENFTQAQKCWAHLLRKAIKLTLIAPDNAEYRRVADDLLEIYREACRVQRDGRLSDAGRARKVAVLEDRVLELCGPVWLAELPPLEGPDNDYRLLGNEVTRLLLAEELFTFVTAAPVTTPTGETVLVAGTNNEAERTLRNPATARDTGRTNKTLAGARRRTIHVSVLESLRCYLAKFTLNSVIAEVQRWLDTGRSCFARMLKKLRLPSPERSVLDVLYPAPSG
jgi:transposase